MNNQRNTHQGTNVEHLFANSIVDHPNALDTILKSVGLPTNHPVDEPVVIGANKRKTDVEIPIPANNQVLRVTVKSFKSSGYNHVERRRMNEFCRVNQIRKSDEKYLTNMWLRKARNGGKGPLVKVDEKDKVRDIFRQIEPGVSALIGNDHPQILAIYNIDESKWYLYDLYKQVIPLVRSDDISLTVRGANIEIGDYIVIQRKGSAGGEYGNDPYSIDHGSNHVQIKMRIKKFAKEVLPTASYIL